MNSKRATIFLNTYSKCPKCGKETLECGKDSLEITENEFTFNCSCGFYVHIIENMNHKKGEKN